MNINISDKGDLVSTIHLTVESSDYLSEYQNELNKRQKDAGLKGFRKGKTPMSFVKKVYANEILSNLVQDKLMKSLYKYISDQGLITIGSPINSDGQEQLEVDYKEPKDYSFSFDVGIAPEFDVIGASENDSYTKFIPELPESMIDEELDKLRKMFGKRTQVKDLIQEGDYVMLHGYEQEEGSPKVEGKEVSFSLLVDDITDEYQLKFLESKVGDKLKFNVYELEKGKTKEFVDKYILKLEEGEEVNSEFEAEISEVSRIHEAEMDQDFFEKVFRGQEVNDEEGARREIRNQMEGGYIANATSVMYRTIMKNLMEKNSFDLPKEFLNRWLFEGKEELAEDEKEKQFADALEEVKWSVIRSKLSKQYDVKVEENDIVRRAQDKAGQMVRQYGLGPEYVKEIAGRIIQNEKEMQQIYLEVETEKMFSKLEEHVKVVEEKMTLDEYEKKREKILESDKQENK